jgi:hypothetical protein
LQDILKAINLSFEQVKGWSKLSPQKQALVKKHLTLHWNIFEGEEIVSFSSRRDIIEIKSRDDMGKYNRFISETKN